MSDALRYILAGVLLGVAVLAAVGFAVIAARMIDVDPGLLLAAFALTVALRR